MNRLYCLQNSHLNLRLVLETGASGTSIVDMRRRRGFNSLLEPNQWRCYTGQREGCSVSVTPRGGTKTPRQEDTLVLVYVLVLGFRFHTTSLTTPVLGWSRPSPGFDPTLPLCLLTPPPPSSGLSCEMFTLGVLRVSPSRRASGCDCGPSRPWSSVPTPGVFWGTKRTRSIKGVVPESKR